MAHQFCEHLDQYGVQFTRTEASYRQCVNLLDQIMAAGPRAELVNLVTAALQEWSLEDQKLRELLVAEVQAGRVRVPHGIVPHQGMGAVKKRRLAIKSGHPVCAECRFVVPRLVYPEWSFAHNGLAAFRGTEFPLPVPAAV